jgi:CheY-like chemotaxis protein
MIQKTILLIEDNPSDIALTKRAFVKHNINGNLIVAKDGQEALDILIPLSEDAFYIPPSLILLDINLPKISGLDVLKQLRSNPQTQRVPVVVLTSSAESTDIIYSYNLGVNSYIRKPVDFVQFSDIINQIATYWLNVNQPPPPIS